MGVTIHYRGQMADLDRVEEFEDRVLDMALEMSAQVTIWRSVAVDDPTWILRGLLLDLVPGQETTSLLLSPEGWLIPLTEFQAAEKGPVAESQLCSVKTQFGSVEGHVALVELLSFMREEYFPNLEVQDEGGYWGSRDSSTLIRRFAEMRVAIESLGNGLRPWGLSPEAAEAPEILAHRIERVARQVQRTLRQAPEHPPVEWDDEVVGSESGGGVGSESQWDAFYKEQRRKQERMHRAIEEKVQQGMESSEAIEQFLREEGLLDSSRNSESWDAETETSEFDVEMHHGWDHEQAEGERSEDAWRDSDVGPVWNTSGFESDEVENNRLRKVAEDLWLSVAGYFDEVEGADGYYVTNLIQVLGEVSGGLAQAFPGDQADPLDAGWRLVQLKRAWRGVAFAQGALIPLYAAGLLKEQDVKKFRSALAELSTGIADEVARIRQQI
jgi:hypothetical protein